jgi:hypothetical protein
VRLRRFLYLDESLTEQYLAQVEGGLYEEEAHISSGHTGSGVQGSIGAGAISAGGRRSSSAEESRTRLIRQTPESAFNRLATLLGDDVQWLEALDDGIWEQLGRGEVLEVECELRIPPIIQFLIVAAQMDQITGLMEITGQQLPSDALQGIQALLAIGDMMQSVPVIGSAVGSPRFKFVAQIRPEYMRAALDELGREVRMFCTLDRKLRADERFSVIDVIPAVRNLPNRSEIEASLDDVAELLGEPVSAPAAIVSAIAIYP